MGWETLIAIGAAVTGGAAKGTAAGLIGTGLAATTASGLAGTGLSIASAVKGAPKPPAIPTPGPDPVEAARATARAQALRRRRGRASTLITGPFEGAGMGAGTSGTKQLLGL